jgi:mRNA-degrading endonuclease RelE of RelBE toxin-antitoxin system
MFELAFTGSALEDLRHLKKGEQKTILKGVEEQLADEPLTETRNRKPLRPNDLSAWEARIAKFRVFYDVDTDKKEVTVKAVGWKEHNKLFIRGKEYEL